MLTRLPVEIGGSSSGSAMSVHWTGTRRTRLPGMSSSTCFTPGKCTLPRTILTT